MTLLTDSVFNGEASRILSKMRENKSKTLTLYIRDNLFRINRLIEADKSIASVHKKLLEAGEIDKSYNTFFVTLKRIRKEFDSKFNFKTQEN